MGSSVNLRKYNCILVTNDRGGVDIKFALKDQFTSEALMSDESESEGDVEDPLSEYKRGMSLYN